MKKLIERLDGYISDKNYPEIVFHFESKEHAELVKRYLSEEFEEDVQLISHDELNEKVSLTGYSIRKLFDLLLKASKESNGKMITMYHDELKRKGADMHLVDLVIRTNKLPDRVKRMKEDIELDKLDEVAGRTYRVTKVEKKWGDDKLEAYKYEYKTDKYGWQEVKNLSMRMNLFKKIQANLKLVGKEIKEDVKNVFYEVVFSSDLVEKSPDMIRGVMCAFEECVESKEIFDVMGDILLEFKPNPLHDKMGNFTNKKGVKGGGSWSMTRKQQRVLGAKGGKLRMKFIKGCGRKARVKGKNVRCWDGKNLGMGEAIAGDLSRMIMETDDELIGDNMEEGKERRYSGEKLKGRRPTEFTIRIENDGDWILGILSKDFIPAHGKESNPKAAFEKAYKAAREIAGWK